MFQVDAKQAFLEHAEGKFQNPNAGEGFSKEAQRVIQTPAEPTISSVVVVGFAQLFEAIALGILGFIISWGYVEHVNYGFYVPTILGVILVYNILSNAARCHSLPAYRSLVKQTTRSTAVWTTVVIGLTVLIFALKIQDQISRVWLVSWYVLGTISIVLFRLGLHQLIRHWTNTGRLRRRTVIVGGGSDAETLIDTINSKNESDLDILGLFDDRIDKRSPESVSGYPKLGNVAELAEFARQTRVDLVMVSMPLSAEERVLAMLKQLWVLPVDIRLSAHMSQLKFTASAYSYVAGVPVFDIADRPISDWNLIFKWVFDKFVALFALLLFSPVMAIVAIAIKLESKGPVIFKQKRHGFNNELIEIYKFRSMYIDKTDAGAAKLVTKNDSRVTKVGKFIRKTSLDELPQFLNVLKGQLSIVGPRPHATEAKAQNKLYYEAVEGYFARHRVRPGITGWAQIHGWRGETDTVDKIMQRVNHDLYYIENWSVFLDAYILFMTPISLITNRENAF